MTEDINGKNVLIYLSDASDYEEVNMDRVAIHTSGDDEFEYVQLPNESGPQSSKDQRRAATGAKGANTKVNKSKGKAWKKAS